MVKIMIKDESIVFVIVWYIVIVIFVKNYVIFVIVI